LPNGQAIEGLLHRAMKTDPLTWSGSEYLDGMAVLEKPQDLIEYKSLG
jgi:hypothetical protein